MSDRVPGGIPEWLSGILGDPIWEVPRRRRSTISTLPRIGSRAHYPQLRETESEPGREPSDWYMLLNDVQETSSTPVGISDWSISDIVTPVCRVLLSRLADDYWAKRGWVLIWIPELGETSLLTSCTEGDSEN